MMSIFRAYDVRGVYGDTLTCEVMEKIGVALATLMRRKDMGSRVFVGADIRESSPKLKDAFIRGALSGGLDVTDVGITSFGIALFSGWRSKADVTAFITASHNPPEWNGIKFYDKDCVGFFEDMNSEIGRMVDEDDLEISARKGCLKREDHRDEYVEYLKKSFQMKKEIKMLADCGNGSTCHSVPNVIGSIEGIDGSMMFDNIDPSFSGRGSDVEKDNLVPLKKKVIEMGADIGCAFDGDGDRCAIVDDKGNILNSDQITYALAKYMYGDEGGTLVINVECSMAIEEQMASRGIEVKRIPVGHTYMMQSARDENAKLGEETAYHFVLPEYFPFDDAIIVPLKLAEILSLTGKKLSEIVEDYPLYPKERIAVGCPDDLKFEVIERLKEKLSSRYDKVNTLDGVRVDLDEGWVLMRVSNTSPMIRITSEAVDKDKVERILSDFGKLLEDEIESLGKKCVVS